MRLLQGLVPLLPVGLRLERHLHALVLFNLLIERNRVSRLVHVQVDPVAQDLVHLLGDLLRKRVTLLQLQQKQKQKNDPTERERESRKRKGK